VRSRGDICKNQESRVVDRKDGETEARKAKTRNGYRKDEGGAEVKHTETRPVDRK
jgi:hypothetical protein